MSQQMMVVLPERVARLRLERQGLAGVERPKADARSVHGVLRRLGQLQVDPMSVVARSEHLALWARLSGYRSEMLDRLRGPGPKVFEYWTRAAALLPMELYGVVAPAMRVRRADAYWCRWVARWLDAHGALAERILAEIGRNGPMGSRDFPGDRPRRAGWGGFKKAKQGLEALCATGQLMVLCRRGHERVYDLTERVLDGRARVPELDEHERVTRLVHVGLRSLGACNADQLAGLFGAVGWPPDAKLTGRRLIEEADRFGLNVLQVRGSDSPWVCLARDRRWLAAAREKGEPCAMRLLGPFDNLMWNRGAAAVLWGFRYKFEAYTPANKREFGVYVMPILWRDRLVGRIDPRFDREQAKLVVNGVWLEPGVRPTKPLAGELAGVLRELAEFLGAADIEVHAAEPRSLHASLCRLV